MKNKILVLVICFVVTLTFSSCSEQEQTPAQNNTSYSSVETTTVSPLSGEITGTESESFVLPVDYLKLDLNTDDLNCNEATFVYDAMERIASCKYYVNGYENYISYTYSQDNTVLIISFVNGVQISEESFAYSSYSNQAGYSTNGGYYFKNLIF